MKESTGLPKSQENKSKQPAESEIAENKDHRHSRPFNLRLVSPREKWIEIFRCFSPLSPKDPTILHDLFACGYLPDEAREYVPDYFDNIPLPSTDVPLTSSSPDRLMLQFIKKMGHTIQYLSFAEPLELFYTMLFESKTATCSEIAVILQQANNYCHLDNLVEKNPKAAGQLICLLDYCYLTGDELTKKVILKSGQLINSLRYAGEDNQRLYVSSLRNVIRAGAPRPVFNWIREYSFNSDAYHDYLDKNKFFLPLYLPLFKILVDQPSIPYNYPDLGCDFARELHEDLFKMPWAVEALVKSQPSEVIMEFLELLEKLKSKKCDVTKIVNFSVNSVLYQDRKSYYNYKQLQSGEFRTFVEELIRRREYEAICFIIQHGLINNPDLVFKDLKKGILDYLKELHDLDLLKEDAFPKITDAKTTWGKLFRAQRSWTLGPPREGQGILGVALQEAKQYEKKMREEKLNHEKYNAARSDFFRKSSENDPCYKLLRDSFIWAHWQKIGETSYKGLLNRNYLDGGVRLEEAKSFMKDIVKSKSGITATLDSSDVLVFFLTLTNVTTETMEKFQLSQTNAQLRGNVLQKCDSI